MAWGGRCVRCVNVGVECDSLKLFLNFHWTWSCFVDLNSDCATTALRAFGISIVTFKCKKLEEIAFLSWPSRMVNSREHVFSVWEITCFALAVMCSWNTFHWVAVAVDMVVTLDAVRSGRLYLLSVVRILVLKGTSDSYNRRGKHWSLCRCTSHKRKKEGWLNVKE